MKDDGNSNSNGNIWNSRLVNFPGECEFSLKKTITKNEILRRYFSRILDTDKGTNNVQNLYLT